MKEWESESDRKGKMVHNCKGVQSLKWQWQSLKAFHQQFSPWRRHSKLPLEQTLKMKAHHLEVKVKAQKWWNVEARVIFHFFYLLESFPHLSSPWHCLFSRPPPLAVTRIDSGHFDSGQFDNIFYFLFIIFYTFSRPSSDPDWQLDSGQFADIGSVRHFLSQACSPHCC